MQEKQPAKQQNATLEDCKSLILTGVNDIIGFEDTAISLDTELGRLEIRGEGMRIDAFDTKVGDMCIEGYIYALVYTKDTKSGGFFKRVFR